MDVEHVFNVLGPKENGHAGSVPHVLQQVVNGGRIGNPSYGSMNADNPRQSTVQKSSSLTA